MGYEKCLKAAGAEVLAFECFGDWQGSWYAKVSYNGEVGWVTGCYGSCSGCDAFEAEFGYSGDESDEELQKRYADFGRSYLDTLYPQEIEEAKLRREIDDTCSDWIKDEARQILDFIVANRELA